MQKLLDNSTILQLDLHFVFLSFNHFTPPHGAPGIFTVPKKRDFATIQIGHIPQDHPVEEAQPILPQRLSSWEQPFKSVTGLTLFAAFQMLGSFQAPVMRKSQISIQVSHSEKPLYVFLLAQPHQSAHATDDTT